MKARKMTPSDFAPHLMATLADLTNYVAEVAVPMGDTFAPVCDRMGIRPEEFGESRHGKKGRKTPWVHRQIGLAMRQLRDKGLGDYAGRGQWMLTQEGLDHLNGADDAEVPTEEMLTAAKALAQQEEQDQEKAGSKVVRLRSNARRHPYSDDPYIRALAIAQTHCFGAYSVRSDVCKECPLAHDCTRAIETRKAEIGAELEHEELAARKAAEAAKKKKDQQDASIDELMASMSDDSFGKKGRFRPSSGQNVADARAQRDTPCQQCDEVIKDKAPCFWVEGEGIFHPQCIEHETS